MIADARVSAGKQVAECARAIGVQPAVFEQYELGMESPSLPELELLAYFLYVPLDHFLGNSALLSPDSASINANVFQQLEDRNRSIGSLLHARREEADLSQEALAAQLGLQVEQLDAYERGEQSIPIPVLEAMTKISGEPLSAYYDQDSPYRKIDNQDQLFQEYLQLPPDIRMFVTKPVNRPYLELAQKLSDMSVEKLRSVAEVLLEITL
ncbi:MAG: helix-turn-helix domain-containing protein [Anaerolineales bacterium]